MRLRRSSSTPFRGILFSLGNPKLFCFSPVGGDTEITGWAGRDAEAPTEARHHCAPAWGPAPLPELRTGPDANAYQASTFTARESPNLSAVLEAGRCQTRVSNAPSAERLERKSLDFAW